MAPTRCSLTLTKCFLLLLATLLIKYSKVEAEEGGSFHPTAQLLIVRYGLFHDPELQIFLDSVFDRIARGANYTDYVYPVIIDSPYPTALSFKDGTVLLSRGLIRSLRSESELAFVFAHEVAHTKLKHFYKRTLGRKDEFKADEIAVRYLIAAGYSPAGALGAIKHSHVVEGVAGVASVKDAATHPTAGERIAFTQKVISSSHCPNIHPTKNERRFLAIKKAAGV